MSDFGKFIGALFSHGNRRYFAMSLPSVLVAVTLFISNSFNRGWKPEWWMWALTILVGLFIASYLAWREEFRVVGMLSGQPALVLLTRGEGFWGLRNTSDHVAVNIEPIKIFVNLSHGLADAYNIGLGHAPTTVSTLTFVFNAVDHLGKDDLVTLFYRVEESPDLQNGLHRYLELALQLEPTPKSIPFCISFSNLQGRRKTWHCHYNILLADKAIRAVHEETSEATSDGMCSSCSRLRK
jgi:hypothetical protein